jgi:CRISPR-associated protein Csd1
MSKFKEGDFESDKPLDGRYLLGYSHQRRKLYNKDKEEQKDESVEEN